MIRVLVVGHAYISQINREKWVCFAKKFPDIELKVLIPKKWKGSFGFIFANNLSFYKADNLEFIAMDSFFTGNEVLYGYNFLNLIKLLKNYKPDLIHVEQGDNSFSYFQLIFLSKIFCKKSKFVFFTWVNWKHKWSLKYKLFWKFIEKYNLKNSSAAIVGNQDAAKLLIDKQFIKPIKVLLQLGVNQKYFIPAKKIENNKKLNIGFIGKIVEQKGVLDLAKAFEKLSLIYPDWNLIFVGGGNFRQELSFYLKQNKLEDRVSILESVEHEQVGNILQSLDIFVLPSFDNDEWREQFGHVLIEAMACRIPVIGSTGGEIPNVIADAGLIFKQRDIFDLQAKLSSLMKSVDLRNYFAIKGYDRFKKNFSYEIIANKTYNFWKSIL